MHSIVASSREEATERLKNSSTDKPVFFAFGAIHDFSVTVTNTEIRCVAVVIVSSLDVYPLHMTIIVEIDSNATRYTRRSSDVIRARLRGEQEVSLYSPREVKK